MSFMWGRGYLIWHKVKAKPNKKTNRIKFYKYQKNQS